MQAGQPRKLVSALVRTKFDWFSTESSQTRSVALLAFYLIGMRSISPEIKRPGRETNYSPPPSAQVKNTCSGTCVTVCILVW